jgi:hypothetical protein
MNMDTPKKSGARGIFLTWGLREGANGGGGEGMGLDLLCDTVSKLGRPAELALLYV